ncbi:hypothetical protein DSO57_1020774 [Entomophthora muscae]|uniref:Uncharacterized protein n=1 Tax=Entomophthora muscae TaxID=34485 RepID=A0ACC2TS14_9FUNG|nr:hypothetical protein DSO57_1020774 [Entomophthora muscae]
MPVTEGIFQTYNTPILLWSNSPQLPSDSANRLDPLFPYLLQPLGLSPNISDAAFRSPSSDHSDRPHKQTELITS